MSSNGRSYSNTNYTSLITKDLHYCCPWLFFQLFKRDTIIAARLGISQQRVNVIRHEVKAGKIKCLACPKCMKKDLLYIKENLPKA